MSLYAELFQHLMFVNPVNKEIPKRYKMSQRGTSCANLYEASVRNDGRVFAFTLAEVLITLVIIGVVAALTIPNLMQKYTEQTTVKKVQKFYSNLSNAYSLALKNNGTVKEWGITGYNTESAEKIYQTLFKPYFKIAKNCGTTNTGNCITNGWEKYRDNNPAHQPGSSKSYYKISLEDGMTVYFRARTEARANIYVYFDTNGAKNPNTWGEDLFLIFILNDKVFPSGNQSGAYSKYPFVPYCTNKQYGYGCTAWVVYKGNMDYLHCDGLTWNSRSCKDK